MGENFIKDLSFCNCNGKNCTLCKPYHSKFDLSEIYKQIYLNKPKPDEKLNKQPVGKREYIKMLLDDVHSLILESSKNE